ncbi:hypothetical protein FB45DRAFT_1051196 [Roridomyces roridus]|uniref:Uncharacterized protein n=1 Tax=Roridomyces roridus TaxID=1738132 RepID=A0AAD7CDN6_9AGAR|nr:hypothetical protein FB45DRAFT_1051196 [Roridomyces roridus]
MSNDILPILCFVAFLVGQLFNSICAGIASPVVPNVLSPTGWSLSSVVMIVVVTLLVHDAVILTAVWYYFRARHMACKTDMASRIRLLFRIPLLLPPTANPRRLLLPPPPSLVSPSLSLVVNIAYLARRWVFAPIGSGWLTVPRSQRALPAPHGNALVVQLAWKAIVSFKVAAKTYEGVVLNTFGLLNLSVVVRRPLRAPSVWRVRILPSLGLYQDLNDILLIVDSALAAWKALKPPPQDVHQDDSVTLIGDSESMGSDDELKLPFLLKSAVSALDEPVPVDSDLQLTFATHQEVQDASSSRPSLGFKIPITALFQRTVIRQDTFSYIDEAPAPRPPLKTVIGEDTFIYIKELEYTSYQEFAEAVPRDMLFEERERPNFAVRRPPPLAILDMIPPPARPSQLQLLSRLRLWTLALA